MLSGNVYNMLHEKLGQSFNCQLPIETKTTDDTLSNAPNFNAHALRRDGIDVTCETENPRSPCWIPYAINLKETTALLLSQHGRCFVSRVMLREKKQRQVSREFCLLDVKWLLGVLTLRVDSKI